MKKFELKETRIPNLFYTELLQKTSCEIPEAEVANCYNGFFMAMANFCSLRKEKETPIAFINRDLKDNFIMGLVVKYKSNENEETEEKGNWEVFFTLDEEDVKDAKKFYNNDTAFNYTLSTVTRELHGFRYANPEVIPHIIESLLSLLLKWLDEEAKPGEDIVIEIPGCFEGTITVENDKKIKAIVPGENMKNVVKGDSML